MALFVGYCPQFWCYGGDLHGPWHSAHVWEAWPKTCCFYIFGPFLWAIVHSFGFSGWFSSPLHLVLVWHAWPKTRCFCIYSRFCELLPTVFWVLGDLHGPWHLVHVWEAWPKTHRFWITRPLFSWAIAHCFGFLRWFTRPMTLLNVWKVWPKTHHFYVFGQFRELLSTILGFRGDFEGP
jgi:hypothetical protein